MFLPYPCYMNEPLSGPLVFITETDPGQGPGSIFHTHLVDQAVKPTADAAQKQKHEEAGQEHVDHPP